MTHTHPGAGDAVTHADGAVPPTGWTQPAGGSHAPFTHVQPLPGDEPTQPVGPALGAVTVAPVTNVKSSEDAVSPGFTSVA